jgi:hypothetical protein
MTVDAAIRASPGHAGSRWRAAQRAAKAVSPLRAYIADACALRLPSRGPVFTRPRRAVLGAPISPPNRRCLIGLAGWRRMSKLQLGYRTASSMSNRCTPEWLSRSRSS